MKKIITFIFSMIMSFIPGMSAFVVNSGNTNTWYAAMEKSALTPPGWFFGVIWNLLYFMLGLALYLVLDKNRENIKKVKPLTIFIIHMILNGFWTIAFFGLHLPVLSVFIVIALLIVAIFMQDMFGKYNKYAKYLVWPYIAWLCCALYLNSTFVYLN